MLIKQCPWCNGEGEFIEADRFADGEGRRNIRHIKCEHCEGDGWIETDEPYEETGEVRPPLQGEYFLNSLGEIEQARFDSYIQKYTIVRIRVEEVPEKGRVIEEKRRGK